VPCDCNWSWRKILKFPPLIWEWISHTIRNGKTTYLWWDSWHPEGPLMEKHNRRIIIHETGIPSDAKVPSVIENKFVGYSVLMELRMIRRLEN